jgi:hypothetical protein
MATTYHYLSGKTKWCKVRTPDKEYNNFQVPLYMDDASWKTFESLGTSLGTKHDKETGEPYVTFKRPVNKTFGTEVVEFGPPKVLDKNNQEMPEGLIGNGSEVTIKISVYDLKKTKGKGHRLEVVRVDNLVEYIPTPKAEGNVATGGPAIPF